jgi:hypothetical protein
MVPLSDDKTKCALCQLDIDRHSPATWKQVIGWVGGPRKDSMRLRENTGKFAHDACVAKVQKGQAIDQPDLWDEPEEQVLVESDVSKLEELLDE